MLAVHDLHVAYPVGHGVVQAVRGVSFHVAAGEFFTLLGPSGCGKTTVLRSVAGLETPVGGRIDLAGQPVFDADRRRFLPPQRRNIAMVFQSYAIWPHMTVAENVRFPLEALGTARAKADAEVARALALVGLQGLAARPATQLSGGQQQRVALARAIVKGAHLLLLDEPLSNLDAKLREQMRRELRALQHRLGQTTLYVTHDQEEALSLSDRIALMEGGRIVEVGTPQSLYLQPRHAFTARFLGQAILLPVLRDEPAGAGRRVETPVGWLASRVMPDPPLESAPGLLMLRPEHIRLLDEGQAPAENVLAGTVAEARFTGRMVEYDVRIGEQTLTVQTPSEDLRPAGTPVRLHLPPERCVPLAADPVPPPPGGEDA